MKLFLALSSLAAASALHPVLIIPGKREAPNCPHLLHFGSWQCPVSKEELLQRSPLPTNTTLTNASRYRRQPHGGQARQAR